MALDSIRRRFPWLERIWADGGYNAWQVGAAKDFENLAETLVAFVTLASIQLTMRRLAKA